MWQKLNRLDVYELEKARVQLTNAIQLVSAAPCSFTTSSTTYPNLIWNNDNDSIESCDLDVTNSLKVTLDMQQLILSIIGKDEHKEHLVLSGITYPMAFGWMKIKIDSFGLDSDLYDDSTEYTIERMLGPNEELNVTNQHIFNELTIHYENAYYLLSQFKNDLKIDFDLYIDPKNLSLCLPLKSIGDEFILRFTPGDKNFLEPHFALQLPEDATGNLKNSIPPSGFWNNKDWTGMVLLAGDFLSLEPEIESAKVYDFLKFNYDKIIELIK